MVTTIRLPEPQQKVFNGVEMPLVLKCNKPGVSLEETMKWVEQNQSELTRLKHHHGAILFRGFPLVGAVEFDHFVQAFRGWEELTYEQSLSYAVRLKVRQRSPLI